jgi:glucose-1-phosphate thymidylyltransferase
MARGLIAIRGASEGAPWVPELPALTPVANRPLVLHAIDAVRAAGATEVVIAADQATLLAAAPVLAEAGDVIRLELVGGVSAADAMVAGAELLRGERIIVHDAEGMLVRSGKTLGSALAADHADATVFFCHPGDLVTGVHVFSDSILGALAATPPGADGCRSLLAGVDRLAAGGGRVQAGVLEGWHPWADGAEALLELNRIVLDAMEPVTTGASLEGSRLEGRVSVHPTARLVNAVVRGPAIIGAHARVTDAYVGPFTTVGDGATIENSEIESSIVLPRARIRHVGVRVEASVIGANA